MNRDNLVIQIAVAMIIIALIGLMIMRSQDERSAPLPTPQVILEGSSTAQPQQVEKIPRLVENVNSDQTNVVKSYFRALANGEYAQACDQITKCNGGNANAVELFSTEHKKLKNGYEYVNVKDLGFESPSGKDVVCVKYSYRYKQDTNPNLVSEVMSFYTQTIDGKVQITDRVCEKKYKDGEGVRPCPIEPAARYCVGNVR